MSLQAELDERRAQFMAHAPADIREAMFRADAALAESDLIAHAVRTGDMAPDFELPDVHGAPVRLSALLARGPVVLSFYRGGWCPYCNMALRALQRALPDMAALGATLVAISPQTPDESLSTVEKNQLAFPVLSDANSRVARDWRIAFDLAEELRPIYARLGHALPDRNGDDSWVLPIPATYVIGRDGRVALHFLDTDYRRRQEPDEVLAALRALPA